MLANLYLKAPAFLQNVALSIYGAKTYRERFGGNIPEDYIHLSPSFSTPTEAEYEKQSRRLYLLLQHCATYVPYYKKMFQGVDLSKINPRNLSDFVPKLSKPEVILHHDLLLSTHPDFKGRLIKLNTSGSSGTPLTIYSTLEARRVNYRFYEQLLLDKGTTYRSRSTTFAGRLLYKETSHRIDRYDSYNNTQYLSTYFISDTTINKYIEALNYWKPEFIDSYPSALIEIQRLARSKGLSLSFKPKFILTSSETLSLQARTDIEVFFGAKVVDHYGCTEMTVSAFSEGGQYFANPLFSVLELDPQGGNRHSLITTGLLNFAMPLLRYEIGDCVVTEDPSNPYRFNYVEGRMDDVIVTPEGRRVGRIDPAFKGVEGIELAQVVQEELDKITVTVVLDKERKHLFDEMLLINNLKQRTSQLIEVRVDYQEKIEKGPNGKFKSVVSNVSKSQRTG